MAQLISTKSGHCYDLDDPQWGLRYIVEQELGPKPSHVIALVYNAIEHIERQNMELERLRAALTEIRDDPILADYIDPPMRRVINRALSPNTPDEKTVTPAKDTP